MPPAGCVGGELAADEAVELLSSLVDKSLLQPLAEACAEEGRYEFMLTIAPLPWYGGTGSPVNPIALF